LLYLASYDKKCKLCLTQTEGKTLAQKTDNTTLKVASQNQQEKEPIYCN